jgi:NADPH:quinone reductase-like Zn-dependent oxidoreductase
MERLAGLVGEGKLRIVVDSLGGFKDALKVYERIISKHASGKVVVRVFG